VSQRTAEIGVRLALGATTARVVRQIVRESLRVIGTGTFAGWVISLLIAMHVRGGVISLPVFVGVPAILLLVAIVACWIPARRAAGIDPVVALRSAE
jgi:ABC-type antimicrobial peptide transport system permease subunit